MRTKGKSTHKNMITVVTIVNIKKYVFSLNSALGRTSLIAKLLKKKP